MGEWSARHVLAHLIGVEHDLQVWLASIAQDTPAERRFYSNGLLRLDAIVSAFNSAGALLDVLQRSRLVTLKMISSLPGELVQRKYLVRTIHTILADLVEHTAEHLRELELKLGAPG